MSPTCRRLAGRTAPGNHYKIPNLTNRAPERLVDRANPPSTPLRLSRYVPRRNLRQESFGGPRIDAARGFHEDVQGLLQPDVGDSGPSRPAKHALARAGVQVNTFCVGGISGYENRGRRFFPSPGDGDGVLACGKVAKDVGARIAGDGLER